MGKASSPGVAARLKGLPDDVVLRPEHVHDAHLGGIFPRDVAAVYHACNSGIRAALQVHEFPDLVRDENRSLSGTSLIKSLFEPSGDTEVTLRSGEKQGSLPTLLDVSPVWGAGYYGVSDVIGPSVAVSVAVGGGADRAAQLFGEYASALQEESDDLDFGDEEEGEGDDGGDDRSEAAVAGRAWVGSVDDIPRGRFDISVTAHALDPTGLSSALTAVREPRRPHHNHQQQQQQHHEQEQDQQESEIDNPSVEGAVRTALSVWRRTQGLAVFVERGTPVGFSLIEAARGAILSTGEGYVVAPCPHSLECPITALNRERALERKRLAESQSQSRNDAGDVEAAADDLLSGGFEEDMEKGKSGDRAGKRVERAAPATWCHFAQQLQMSPTHRGISRAKRDATTERLSYVVIARGRDPSLPRDVSVARDGSGSGKGKNSNSKAIVPEIIDADGEQVPHGAEGGPFNRNNNNNNGDSKNDISNGSSNNTDGDADDSVHSAQNLSDMDIPRHEFDGPWLPGRLIQSPVKRGGHVIVDACSADGSLVRRVFGKRSIKRVEKAGSTPADSHAQPLTGSLDNGSMAENGGLGSDNGSAVHFSPPTTWSDIRSAKWGDRLVVPPRKTGITRRQRKQRARMEKEAEVKEWEKRMGSGANGLDFDGIDEDDDAFDHDTDEDEIERYLNDGMGHKRR